MGKTVASKVCSRYSPDVFTLFGSQAKVTKIDTIADVINNLDSTDLAIFAGVLLTAKKLKRFGFTFYQKVYVRVSTPGVDFHRNYLNNFAIGHVIHADKESVWVVGAELNGAKYRLNNDKQSTSFYTVGEFALMRKEMVENNRFVAPPSNPSTFRSIIVDDKYVPPTIDVPPIDVAEKRGDIQFSTRGKRKVSKEGKDDLVTFLSKLSRGIMKTTKKTSRRAEMDGSTRITY